MTAKQTKKKKPEPKKERTPRVLSFSELQMSDDDLLSLVEARKENKLDEFNERMMAKVATMPEARAARVIQRYEGDGLDVNYELAELRRLTAEVRSGSMATPEAMLVSQAHTLDALFSNMAMRAYSNMKEGYLDATDRYMRIALKAQAQATRTIEALAALKNPPVVYARNANVVNGPQQVNQTVAGGSFETSTRLYAHTGNFKNEPSKLSGERHELLENARTSSHEGATNTAMEALGAFNGAAHIGR